MARRKAGKKNRVRKMRVEFRAWVEWLSSPIRLGFFGLILVMCFTLGPLLRYSIDHQYFLLRRIDVVGTRHVDPSQVRMWLGMVEGRSIWRTSARGLQDVLEAKPTVKSARVSRIFPDRLRVELIEHEAVALLHQGSRFLLVSEDGVVFGQAAGGPDPTLPIISISPDVDPLPATWRIAEAVSVARLLDSGNAGLAISEVAFEGGAGQELVGFADHGRLRLELGWGHWGDKFTAVRRVLTQVLSPEGAAAGHSLEGLGGTVDVRDPSAVVARWDLLRGAA